MINAELPSVKPMPAAAQPGIGVEHRDHDRHVGAADRHDDEYAERERHDHDHPERDRALRRPRSRRSKSTSRIASAMLMACRIGSMIGAPLMRPDSFMKAITRAREGDGADGDAERHLDEARPVDVAGSADVEGARRIERAGRDQHRRHADQRVERRDQFRHRGHRHAPRDHGAGAAAGRDAEHRPGSRRRRRPAGARRAWSATAITMPTMPNMLPLAARFRARQPAQRQDEQHAGDEIEQAGQIGIHAGNSLLATTVAFAGGAGAATSASFLLPLVHAEHALRDQEAAENVHRGEDERDEAERARQRPARPRCRAAPPRRRAARRPRSPRRSHW